jgi:uncharacterized protein YbjT (DUF2867 family)
LKEDEMKIVVIGGTGQVGAPLVRALDERGHQAVAASPSTGVDARTGHGLAEALAGAQVVVDVANAPSFDPDEVLDFFRTSTRHLLDAEAVAGVAHHVALSIVGADRLPDAGYLRAKVAQEELIRRSGRPHTIVRSTQFFEFLRTIAAAGQDGDVIRLPEAALQPIAAADVVTALVDVVLAPPVDGVVEIAGPRCRPLPDLARAVLAGDGDERPVVGDPDARYFGTRIDDSSLTAGPGARLGATTFEEWLAVRTG